MRNARLRWVAQSASVSLLAVVLGWLCEGNGVLGQSPPVPPPAEPAGPSHGDCRKAVSEAKSEIERALKRGELAEIAHWVESLGSLNCADALAVILRIGEGIVKDPVRSAVQSSLARTTGASAIEYLGAELAKAKSVARALLIAEALEEIDSPNTIPPLLEALDRVTDPRVRNAVLRALARKPDKAVVTKLIAFLHKIEAQQDTTWAEARIALLAVTGQAFVAHEDWVNWWEVARENWQPPPAGREGDDRPRTGIYRPGRADLQLPQIFGQEVASKRVVFVVDTSRSMEKVDPTSMEEGGTGGGPTRMERAKRELSRVVGELRADVEFNIVEYNSRATLWIQDKLVTASAANKRKAIQWIASWEPSGFTATLEAMSMALEVPGVDTIILLSDGSPTIVGEGTIAPIPPILDAIRETNRFKGITIHTLGFEGSLVSFMKDMAQQNGGVFAKIK
ncbi:MAG: VWA domain-containing protein [Planctomycetota bacterium]